MLRRTAVVVVAAAVTVALSGCSGSVSIGTPPSSSTPVATASQTGATEVAEGTLDQNVLAEAITSNLTDSLGAGVAVSAVCPAGVALTQGATSTCEALVDGQKLEFTITQSDDAGNVDFTPTAAVLDVVKLQTQTAQQYGEQKGGTWTGDCGAAGKAYLVQPVGAVLECTFTSESGTTAPYTVTIDDLDGNISWSES